MKVKSTGLGKTQLTSHIDGFYIKEDGTSAVMVIESTEPVHWHIECDMGGSDLRQFARLVLKPRTLARLISLLAKGGEAKGFVLDKDKGGRRAGGATRAKSAKPAAAVPAAEAPGADTSAEAPAAAGQAIGENGHRASEAAASAPPPLLSLQTLRESEGSLKEGERGEREQRRAERRRRREQAAQAQPTAG